MKEQYDFIVIGSGPAGQAAAMMAAKNGMKVALVEKSSERVGGVCLNEGCIPAKSMFHTAEIIDSAKKYKDILGLEQNRVKIDYAGILDKSREAVEKLKNGLLFVLKKNDIDLIFGTGSFKDKQTVCVVSASGGKTDLRAGKILVAAGAKPKSLPGIEFDGKKIVTSSDIMSLDVLPGNIAIIGAGAIGVEFASYFNLLGTDVTLIEAEKTILPLEDKETAKALSSVFRKRGINIKTERFVKSVKVSGEKVKVIITAGGDSELNEYDLVLISTGRSPSTGQLQLGAIGIETDRDGFIKVDKHFKTSIENIYAAGDIVQTPMLAHVASAEGEQVVKTFLGGRVLELNYSHIPNAVYSKVKVASIGFTEELLKKKQINYKSGKHFFKANGRAVVAEEDQGFIKILADSDTRKILGVHIVGHNADEIIHEFVVAVKYGLTVEAVSEIVHAHPTFSESAAAAAKSVFK